MKYDFVARALLGGFYGMENSVPDQSAGKCQLPASAKIKPRGKIPGPA